MKFEGAGNRFKNIDPAIDAEAIDDHEKSARKFVENYPEAAIKTLDIFDRINFEGLRDVIAEIADKAGARLARDHFVSREQTYVLYGGEKQVAAHVFMTGTNIIDGQWLNEFLTDHAGNEKVIHATILHALAHENTHAMGAAQLDCITEQHILGRVGYQKIDSHSSTSHLMFLFNEGITELIAERVASEYFK